MNLASPLRQFRGADAAGHELCAYVLHVKNNEMLPLDNIFTAYFENVDLGLDLLVLLVLIVSLVFLLLVTKLQLGNLLAR